MVTYPQNGTGAGSRVVVVTGGSRGIGKAIVEEFARLGDSVIALGRNESTLRDMANQQSSLGHQVDFYVCDVSSEDEVEDVFGRLGAVDILVNNAGVSTSAPIHKVTLEQWQQQIAVNATGAFLCTRTVISSMRARDKGRLIFVASTAAVIGYPYSAGYVASKHAQVGLMRAMATEFAGSGITANAVCPSFVRTEMTESSVRRIAKTTDRGEDEAADILARSSPLGRFLEPREVATSVVFLASEDARAVNGQLLVIDGGGVQK